MNPSDAYLDRMEDIDFCQRESEREPHLDYCDDEEEDERRYVNTMAALAQIITELGLANKLKVLELEDRFRDSELGLAKVQEIVDWFQEETAKNQAMIVQRPKQDGDDVPFGQWWREVEA